MNGPLEEELGEQTRYGVSADGRAKSKRTLLQLSASYDRGFGATGTARRKVKEVISELVTNDAGADAVVFDVWTALQGTWRMVWTTTQDVLLLGASPISTVGPIYQVFKGSETTNIFDLLPRAQAILPPGLAPSSVLRVEVTTKTIQSEEQTNRVVLDLDAVKSVKVKPMELLGFNLQAAPPLGFELPRLTSMFDAAAPPGYIDVFFIDVDMVALRQNSPGGEFVFVRVPSTDP